MKLAVFLWFVVLALGACASPENTRTRGGGPGADVGNRGQVVKMHEGSEPFYQTPQIIAVQHAPIGSASQAERLSR